MKTSDSPQTLMERVAFLEQRVKMLEDCMEAAEPPQSRPACPPCYGMTNECGDNGCIDKPAEPTQDVAGLIARMSSAEYCANRSFLIMETATRDDAAAALAAMDAKLYRDKVQREIDLGAYRALEFHVVQAERELKIQDEANDILTRDLAAARELIQRCRDLYQVTHIHAAIDAARGKGGA